MNITVLYLYANFFFFFWGGLTLYFLSKKKKIIQLWFGLVYINLIKMCIVTEIELIVRIWSNHQIVVYDILYDYIWYSNMCTYLLKH